MPQTEYMAEYVLLINSDISLLCSVTLQVRLCNLLVSKPLKLAFPCPDVIVITSAHLISLKHPQSLKWTEFKMSPTISFFLQTVFIKKPHSVPPTLPHQILPWKYIFHYLAGKVGTTIKEIGFYSV